MLYARVSRKEVRPGRTDDALTQWKQLLASQRGTPDFHDAYFLVDRSARIGLAISMWDSMDQVEQHTAAQQGLVRLAGEFAALPATEPSGCGYGRRGSSRHRTRG